MFILFSEDTKKMVTFTYKKKIPVCNALLLRIIRGNSKDKNIPHRKNRDAVVISTKGIT